MNDHEEKEVLRATVEDIRLLKNGYTGRLESVDTWSKTYRVTLGNRITRLQDMELELMGWLYDR